MELITGKRYQFTSNHFNNFSEIWHYKHEKASYYYFQSHDFFEDPIQTIKHTLKKVKYDQ